MPLYSTSFLKKIEVYLQHNGLAGPAYDENRTIYFKIKHVDSLCIRGLKKLSLKLKIGIIYK